MLLHELHAFVVHEGAVLDAVDAAAHRALDAFGTMSVRGHLEAIVPRRRDHGADLLFGHLRIGAVLGDRQHAAGGGDLDGVGAVLVTLAHRLARVLDAVDDAFFGTRIGRKLARPAVGGIRMAAGAGDGLAGGDDARARHLAGIDGVAQRDRRAELVAEVAHRGEAG